MARGRLLASAHRSEVNESHSLSRKRVQFPIRYARTWNLSLRVVVELTGEFIEGPELVDLWLQMRKRATGGCTVDQPNNDAHGQALRDEPREASMQIALDEDPQRLSHGEKVVRKGTRYRL